VSSSTETGAAALRGGDRLGLDSEFADEQCLIAEACRRFAGDQVA
jgi:hypothetical protein